MMCRFKHNNKTAANWEVSWIQSCHMFGERFLPKALISADFRRLISNTLFYPPVMVAPAIPLYCCVLVKRLP